MLKKKTPTKCFRCKVLAVKIYWLLQLYKHNEFDSQAPEFNVRSKQFALLSSFFLFFPRFD